MRNSLEKPQTLAKFFQYMSLISLPPHSLDNILRKIRKGPRSLEEELAGLRDVSNSRAIDVTYQAKMSLDHEVCFTEHLQELPKLPEELGEFPVASEMYFHLVKKRNLGIRILRRLYEEISSVQRKFIYTDNPTDLVGFLRDDAANRLDVNAAMLGYLRKDRFLCIENKGGVKVYPTIALMPDPKSVEKMKMLSQVNLALQEEHARGKAYSAETISRRVTRSVNLIRRYLKDSGVPNTQRRNQAYQSGVRTAFSIQIIKEAA